MKVGIRDLFFVSVVGIGAAGDGRGVDASPGDYFATEAASERG